MIDANKKTTIDDTKYLSSLSLICTNAEFGAVITRKIIFRSKEDEQNTHCYFVMFISIVIVLSEYIMGFFDIEKGVEQYIKMAEGYDGAELIKILQKYLPKDSTVLELGIDPGKDMDILK